MSTPGSPLQLKHRARWLEVIRQRVMDGTFAPTAALARMLGLPFADGALLEDQRSGARLGNPAVTDLGEIRRRFYADVGRLH